jgi:hypothetical protein
MRALRWFAVLPSAGGLAVSLMALTAGLPAASAVDAIGVRSPVTVAAGPVTPSLATEHQRYLSRLGTLERRAERRADQEAAQDRRAEAAQDQRQAARQAARRAAAAARRAAAAVVPSAAPSGQVGTGGMGGFEACVIAAESGGNPRAYNSSSGASGLFGFLLTTWDSLNLGYPGGASTAPATVQEQGFAIEYARAGVAPWAAYDGC